MLTQYLPENQIPALGELGGYAAQNQEYYLNGFVCRKFRKDADWKRLLEVLKALDENEPKAGFHWSEQFEGTRDLAPNAYTYDPIFIDFALKQGLIEFARNVSGEHLHLNTICLRKVFPGNVYMGWHRDTYAYRNRPPAGSMPAMHKMIFYPSLGEKPEVQLKVIPGSQLRFFRSKLVDRLQTVLMPSAGINSSDENLLFFNSGIFHSTTNVSRQKGCYRLFYYFNNTHLHQKTMDPVLEEMIQARAAALGIKI